MTPSGPLNSAVPTTAFIIGGVYNVTSPAPASGQALPFQLDANGNLLVNIAAGAAGGTQYVDGVTQVTPTGTVALGKNPTNILHALSLDASGNLNINIAAGSSSGIQFADNVASGAAPTGTLAMGWDSANSKIRAFKVDATQDLFVAFSVAQHIIVDSGSVSITGTPTVDVTDRVGRLLGVVASITAAVDISDRAARLVGVVYGSQAQQLKQTATNFNLQTELATGGTLYDARQIRALTSTDVITAAQTTAANLQATVTQGTSPWATSAPGVQSAGNSSTVALGSGGVFTGTFEDVSNYAAVSISVFADQASAASGLSFQWSPDGVNADVSAASSVSANSGRGFSISHRGRFFRIVYTNGAVAQGAFRLQATYHVDGSGLITKPYSAAETSDNFASQVRAAVAGLDGSNLNLIAAKGASTAAVAADESLVVAISPNSPLPTGANVIGAISLPVNASQETGGNLVTIVNQTRNDAQIVDLLTQLLAQVRYNGLILASSSTSVDMDDPDLITVSL
jgi:hypothetical protein